MSKNIAWIILIISGGYLALSGYIYKFADPWLTDTQIFLLHWKEISGATVLALLTFAYITFNKGGK